VEFRRGNLQLPDGIKGHTLVHCFICQVFFFFQRPMKWGRMLVGTTNGQMLAPPALQWQAGAKLKSAETALNHLQLISVRAGTLYLT
jgi:hypothetical protein